MCKYLASKGARVTVMHKHFLSKGPLPSLISSVSYFTLGIEAFSGVLSGNRTEFWAPCDSVAPPNWGVWSAADTALLTSVVSSTSWKVFALGNTGNYFLLYGITHQRYNFDFALSSLNVKCCGEPLKRGQMFACQQPPLAVLRQL